MIDPLEYTQRYYSSLASAYIRGMLRPQQAQNPLFLKALSELTEAEEADLYQLGKEHELRLHRFKRNRDLPRVKKMLGHLRGLQPENLLDIGTGRGVFLWPLLDLFPHLPIHCLDVLDYRVRDLQAFSQGGYPNVRADQIDICDNQLESKSYDGITLLETLEHIPNPAKAIAEVCRLARRFVLISVPSKEDDNPEHIHLFTQDRIKELFYANGWTKLKFEFVLNHLLMRAMP